MSVNPIVCCVLGGVVGIVMWRLRVLEMVGAWLFMFSVLGGAMLLLVGG